MSATASSEDNFPKDPLLTWQLRLLRVALASFAAVEVADRVLSRAFPYRWTRDVVLDTILGPADSDEYVSRTAPAGPPPTIS